MKPGVDGKVFIANAAGENVKTFSLVDNQTFRQVRINDVILVCQKEFARKNFLPERIRLHTKITSLLQAR